MSAYAGRVQSSLREILTVKSLRKSYHTTSSILDNKIGCVFIQRKVYHVLIN